MSKQKASAKTPFYKKKALLWTVGGIAGVILLVAIAFRISPWPGALLIRAVFASNTQKTLRALEAHTPSVAITTIADQRYRLGDNDAKLDVYFPSNTTASAALPTIIWTHGGAWLSGDKANAAPYYKLLAAEGFTVIALNYSLAPGSVYPTAVHQLNDAYAYIQTQAERFHVDTHKFVFAGDSAGSQLSSQMAAIITNPRYAQEVSVRPNLKPAQLRGVVLTCGIYMMDGLTQPDPTLPKIVGWGDDISVWAYSGTKDFSDPVIKEMSAYYHVTKDFPATYITGGNGDPLTKAQSVPFADLLEGLGVVVTRQFYASDHQPSLPHEYQFNIDTIDGQNAFKQIVAFTKQQTK